MNAQLPDLDERAGRLGLRGQATVHELSQSRQTGAHHERDEQQETNAQYHGE